MLFKFFLVVFLVSSVVPLLKPKNKAMKATTKGMAKTSNLNLPWRQLPGACTDIGVGSTGAVYVVGTDSNIYQFTYASNNWNTVGQLGKGFVRVDVGPNGQPWGVDSQGLLWNLQGGSWVQIGPSGTCVKDVGVGMDGTVGVIGCDVEPSGNWGIYKWMPTTLTWTKLPGYAIRIDVGPQGQFWVVNAQGGIYTTNDWQNWTGLPGWASDITAANDNIPVVIGSGQTIWRWTTSTNNWLQMSGAATQISAGPFQLPWVCNSALNIWSSATQPY